MNEIGIDKVSSLRDLYGWYHLITVGYATALPTVNQVSSLRDFLGVPLRKTRKTKLIGHYTKTLGAKLLFGQNQYHCEFNR